MRFPLVARVGVVVGIAIALLIPLASIRDKIAERRDRAEEVQKAYAAQTSGPQVLAGPFLALTCEETYVEEHVVHLKNGKPLTVREKKQRACASGLFLPKNLALEGALPVEQRYRGIYPLRLYRAQLGLSGEFELPAPPSGSDDIAREWKDAYLVVAIRDVRGAAFAMVEIAWGIGLHPVQYGLVGLALAVFFLLLIALSEHVAFLAAYVASAGACLGLMTYYLRHPLGSRSRTMAFGALFAALYGALYVLLKSEDHALLLGSLLVFGVLATLMALTRKLDWAALSGRLRQPLADPA